MTRNAGLKCTHHAVVLQPLSEPLPHLYLLLILAVPISLNPGTGDGADLAADLRQCTDHNLHSRRLIQLAWHSGIRFAQCFQNRVVIVHIVQGHVEVSCSIKAERKRRRPLWARATIVYQVKWEAERTLLGDDLPCDRRNWEIGHWLN